MRGDVYEDRLLISRLDARCVIYRTAVRATRRNVHSNESTSQIGLVSIIRVW